MTVRRRLAVLGLLALAVAVGFVTAIAYLDDSDWPLGPRMGR